jgi:hypothetical protein
VTGRRILPSFRRRGSTRGKRVRLVVEEAVSPPDQIAIKLYA